jgi:hypothetical protein
VRTQTDVILASSAAERISGDGVGYTNGPPAL